MSLTNGRDLYVGINETGFNKVIQYFIKLRPKQFNYGSPLFFNDPKRCCIPVTKGGVSPLGALPIPGTNDLAKIEYAIQLIEPRVDISPPTLPLPPGMNLPDQRFSLTVTVVVSVAFPKLPDDWYPPLDETIPVPQFSYEKSICFRLSAYVICSLDRIKETVLGRDKKEDYIVPRIHSLELVNLEPDEIESIFEIAVLKTLRHGILNKTRIKLERTVGEFFKIVLSNISPNPSIARDRIELWADTIISN